MIPYTLEGYCFCSRPAARRRCQCAASLYQRCTRHSHGLTGLRRPGEQHQDPRLGHRGCARVDPGKPQLFELLACRWPDAGHVPGQRLPRRGGTARHASADRTPGGVHRGLWQRLPQRHGYDAGQAHGRRVDRIGARLSNGVRRCAWCCLYRDGRRKQQERPQVGAF